MFWQVVLMVLMLLTVGFDVFDRWFWWFWCFDSRFWCFDRWFWWFWCFDSRFWQQVLMILTGGFCFWRLYNKWQKVLMVLMFWQVVFVFEGCIINDRRFWWFWCFDSRFWWFWQVVLMVLMFWQQVLMILTGGFCFWRLYNKWQKVLSFEDAVIRKFPSHPGVRIYGCAVKTVHSCEQKVDCL